MPSSWAPLGGSTALLGLGLKMMDTNADALEEVVRHLHRSIVGDVQRTVRVELARVEQEPALLAGLRQGRWAFSTSQGDALRPGEARAPWDRGLNARAAGAPRS